MTQMLRELNQRENIGRWFFETRAGRKCEGHIREVGEDHIDLLPAVGPMSDPEEDLMRTDRIEIGSIDPSSVSYYDETKHEWMDLGDKLKAEG